MTTINDYVLEKELGSGQFGTVYKAIRKSDNKTIALKVIDIPPNQSHLIEKTQEEIETLKTLATPECNPFVICYYRSSYDKINKRFLVEMELVNGETMNNYVKRLWRDNVSKKVYYYLLLIAKDLLKGLEYTHNKGIIHNDIKPENIMIDTTNTPRIVDYGLSCTVVGTNQWGKYCQSNGGTPDYVAPEYLEHDIRLSASDLWALGVTLYQAATDGDFPLNVKPHHSVTTVFNRILSTEPSKLSTKNNQLNELVNGLLIKDPTKRLTAKQALVLLANIDKPVFGVPGSSSVPPVQTAQPTIFKSPEKVQPVKAPRLDEDFVYINNEPYYDSRSDSSNSPYIKDYGFLTPESAPRARDTFGSLSSVKRKQLMDSWLLL